METPGKFYTILFVIIVIAVISLAWYYNSFNIRGYGQELKTTAIDKIDQRPRQLISQEPPAGKGFCIQNDMTNVIGWDEINNCCVYEWRGNDNVLQTCVTAQIGGQTIYNLFNMNYVDDYKNYISEVN